MQKKTSAKTETSVESEMRPEYDFTGGIRGKYHEARRQGYTIKIHNADGTSVVKHIKREKQIVLDPEVREYFPDSNAVNHALRTLIGLFSKERKMDAPGGRGYKNGKKSVAKSSV